MEHIVPSKSSKVWELVDQAPRKGCHRFQRQTQLTRLDRGRDRREEIDTE